MGDLVPIAPDDNADQFADALMIEGGGVLVIITEAGETRTVNVPDFFILPVSVRRILEASTATGIHGFKVLA
ncbi:MAG: hypothetical protein JJU09_00475 [Rhodobacteraceae bacterium]|nr:hypothetical protein [Paracoccaceae bacterium]